MELDRSEQSPAAIRAAFGSPAIHPRSRMIVSLDATAFPGIEVEGFTKRG